MAQVLKKKGWTLQRIKGSHHYFVKEDVLHAVSVPVHGSKILKPKTQRGIMKGASLTDDDL
jgi:predicted RNA binding protein YcfA (HicA-like mRNA interferase family)